MNSESTALFVVVNKNFDEPAVFDLPLSEAAAFVERRGASDYAPSGSPISRIGGLSDRAKARTCSSAAAT